MKKKLMFLIFSITALTVTIILIVAGTYYIAAAIIVGVLVVGHREIWSLLRYRKLPPIDERVRENTNKAMRNSFIFLVIFLILMLLSGRHILAISEYLLGGFLILTEAVYLITYIYYEYMEASLGGRALKILKAFLLLSAISAFVILFNAYFSNFIYHDSETIIKYKMMDITAFIISALGFLIGVIGSLVLFIKGLLARTS